MAFVKGNDQNWVDWATDCSQRGLGAGRYIQSASQLPEHGTGIILLEFYSRGARKRKAWSDCLFVCRIAASGSNKNDHMSSVYQCQGTHLPTCICKCKCQSNGKAASHIRPQPKDQS